MDDLRMAVSGLYPELEWSFVAKKEVYYGWRAYGPKIVIQVSDYLEGAPDPVLPDLFRMIALRSKKRQWSVPASYTEYLRSEGFILGHRPTYIARSKNLARTSVGQSGDLYDSVQRLLDMGLLDDSDIGNSYLSWTRRQSTRRVGFCSTVFRVVGISSRLDMPDVPERVRDYVVYHECLHLRQGYRPGERAHDSLFRQWERSYPGWSEAEASLRKLSLSTDASTVHERREEHRHRRPRRGARVHVLRSEGDGRQRPSGRHAGRCPLLS